MSDFTGDFPKFDSCLKKAAESIIACGQINLSPAEVQLIQEHTNKMISQGCIRRNFTYMYGHERQGHLVLSKYKSDYKKTPQNSRYKMTIITEVEVVNDNPQPIPTPTPPQPNPNFLSTLGNL